MTLPSPAQLAALHQRCFAAHPRPWSEAEFGEIISNPLNFLLARPQGFLLGRTVAGEAELLTLAVAPEYRRRGIAAGLLAEFARTALGRGALTPFLRSHQAMPRPSPPIPAPAGSAPGCGAAITRPGSTRWSCGLIFDHAQAC